MVDILMAVYNGEEFLREQIDSVIAQSYGQWRLFIRDDGSEDGSADIIREYGERFPGKIFAGVNDVPTGSAAANFMGLLGLTGDSSAEYVMFCDQDDVWHEDKIEVTLSKMREIEGRGADVSGSVAGNAAEFVNANEAADEFGRVAGSAGKFGNAGNVKPVLVHTDLEIVDRELNVTAASFMKYQGLDARYKSLNRLLCQNNITGCTVMMNRALADIVRAAPPEYMLMHDWWAGLAAAAFGEIGFVGRATVKYRQHGGNQLGAVNNRSLKGAARIVRERMRTKKRVSVTYGQGERFYEVYKEQLGDEARRVLEIYTDIPNRSKVVRAARLIRYGFLKQNFMTAAGQVVFC
ncbi:MAG: glycosyltransferase family 2 protein [Ruminococcus sp.]|nr:glycosyltransferase family 2 protein [Ruminococcus sp.]